MATSGKVKCKEEIQEALKKQGDKGLCPKNTFLMQFSPDVAQLFRSNDIPFKVYSKISLESAEKSRKSL